MRNLKSHIAWLALVVGALAPGAAWADSGLVVRLKDGSTPINQPDLFANALARSWGDGSRFCTALKSLLPSPGGPNTANGSVASCVATPYGVTGVSMSGRTPVVGFSGKVTLQGSSPFFKETCPFTDVLTVSVQTPLTITGTMLATSSISFAPASVTASVQETWGAPCSNVSGNHPGGISSNETIYARTAASNVNLPGAALNDALGPFVTPLRQALTGKVYEPSNKGGDMTFTVVDSILHQRLNEAPPLRARSQP